MGAFLRKYATGTGADVCIPLIKAGANDFAAGGDWTPASGDVKVSKDGGSQANIATLPTYSNGDWVFVFSNSELTCKKLNVRIVDSATKAIEDDGFNVETYGHASAAIAADLTDAAALGLTSVTAIKAKTDNLPSDPADASDIAGAFSTVNSTLGTIAGYIDTEVAAIKAKTDSLTFTVSGKVDANITHIAGAANSATTAQLGVNVVQISGDATAADNAEADYDGTGYNKSTSTIGTATTIGSTGIAAIWSYAKASAAALATTTIGRYIYDKLAYITSATTLTTSIASDGADVTVYKGSTGSLTLDVPYNGAGDYNFTGRTLKLVFREIGSATCAATATLTGSVSNAGAANQSVAFTWDGGDTTGLALSQIRGEALNASPRYDYAYRWTVASLDPMDSTDSVIVAQGGVKVICDDGASA